jgi:hypothetical protein
MGLSTLAKPHRGDRQSQVELDEFGCLFDAALQRAPAGSSIASLVVMSPSTAFFGPDKLLCMACKSQGDVSTSSWARSAICPLVGA